MSDDFDRLAHGLIVQRVTSNSALVAGVFVPRPPHATTSDWRGFWSESPSPRTSVHHDAFKAIVFGAVIPKPSSVTQAEWSSFWDARTTRTPRALLDTARTARKPTL